MKYKEYQKPDYAQVGKEILSYWKENDIFSKSIHSRAGKPVFTFYEGPPSANGTPGIHHVMARTVKDIFCRYKTMKGYQVKRKGGWDTHGLPVELQVEKQLGITKEDIGKKISIVEYNQRCREAVMKYKDEWDSLTEKMGYWVDLNTPYITFKSTYIESVWSLLKRFYEKGLLYKGYTIQPYSPAAGTGLSSHELNQPGTYRMVKDTSIVAQFKLKKQGHPFEKELFDHEEEELFFLAWTTTPWTLPANSALAIGKEIVYVKVKTFNPYTFLPVSVILAKDRLDNYFNPKAKELRLEDYKPGDRLIPFMVTAHFKGKDLSGMAYEQLLPYVPLPAPAFTVVIGDFVSTEEGTGIVHISKTFGADDYRTCVKYDIPGVLVKDERGEYVPIVDKQGKFVAAVTDFAGKYVKNEYYPKEEAPEKSVDVEISIKLKKENRAFKVEKYEHSYPHCWRTDKPVLYYPLDSWFIKTTAYKDQLVAQNKKINWKPASTGTGRFGNWLENLVDWNLSRSRFWGTPLPIWRTEDGKEEKCIGSLEELITETKKSVGKGFMDKAADKDIDLHRPYVDEIVLVSDSGQKMFRESDLIDVWFDSGAMPYAQWHYPFENEEVFKENFPADFIAEGVDQTRGWFFTLHTIAVILFGNVAFKNVIANGLVLDKNGNKMSKRLGNAIDSFETLDHYGPDATRWYLISNANPWDNLKFDMEGIVEVQRRFLGTLYNTYSFFALYANLDAFDYSKGETSPGKRTESDRWIISKLNSLIAQTDTYYADYEPTKATRAIQDFVIDDLSNWYVRLNRKRFWKGEYNNDKEAAYQTLYTCLTTIAKLAAPVMPFFMDRLYLDLNNVTKKENFQSVHLAAFPSADDHLIDTYLEEKMQLAQRISSLVHSLRKKHKIKVRQPLAKILVPVMNTEEKEKIKGVEELILSEVNVKEIDYDDTSGVVYKKMEPNFRKLGKEHKSMMGDIKNAIESLNQKEINTFEKEETYIVKCKDREITLTLEDVKISLKVRPGWSVASDGKLNVILYTDITNELKQEGIARDLVNRIQNLRKDMGLAVQDKIRIDIQRKEKDTSDGILVNSALREYKSYICDETQALELNLHEQLHEGQLLVIDDLKLKIKLTVIR